MLEFRVVRQDSFYSHQDNEKVNFYKQSSLHFIGWSFRNWKIAACLQSVKTWNISTKVSQSLLFYQHSQLFMMLCKKEIKNLEFVQE